MSPRFANGIHGSPDQWLHERARSKRRPCRADVRRLPDGSNRIASSAIFRLPRPSSSATRFLQRNSGAACPSKYPLLLIGRLAVDAEWRGQGLGIGALGGRIETVPWSIRDRRSAWHCRPRYRRSRHRFLRAPRFRSFSPWRARHADADRNGSVPGRPKHQGNWVKSINAWSCRSAAQGPSSTTSRGSASTSIGGAGRHRRLFRFGL